MAEDAQTVLGALTALFTEWQPPLMMKSDNGAAFRSGEVVELLERHGVVQLLSPPRTPSYNGSCEAGNGGIRTRSHHEAQRNGRPGQWTCEDVEFARCQGNDAGRPRGQAGPTPDERWGTRCPIRPAERAAFRHACAAQAERERESSELDGQALGNDPDAWIKRMAITTVLQQFDLLHLRRA